jgi:DNA replication protein DnaC
MSGKLGDILSSIEQTAMARQKEFEALPEAEKKRILEDERWKEEQEKRDQLIARYNDLGITPIYHDEYWDTWIADTPEKKKAFKTVKDMAWCTNLFLCGKNGTGKTHLAMCLTKDGATYRRLPDIFREVRMRFDSEQRIINHYGTVKFLIIDEVGRQKFSQFEKDLFLKSLTNAGIINCQQCLLQIRTKKSSLMNTEAVLDRLRPIIVRFDWESRREKLNLAKAPVEDDA